MGETVVINYIKSEIAAHGLRMNYVAEQIGMKPHNFSYLLRQKKHMGFAELFKICNYLDLDINYVYELYLSAVNQHTEVG